MSLSQRQRDVLIGTLLGDGCLEQNGRWVRLRVDHGPRQQEYVRWKHRVFRSIAAGDPRYLSVYDDRTNRYYQHWRFDTRSLKNLTQWKSLFYQNGRKIVPKSIAKLLRRPMALAVWFMDDGYRRKDCRGLHLNTQAYNLREQVRLRKVLENNFGLKTAIHWANNRPKLYFPADDAERLRRLLRRYLIPGLAQKLS